MKGESREHGLRLSGPDPREKKKVVRRLPLGEEGWPRTKTAGSQAALENLKEGGAGHCISDWGGRWHAPLSQGKMLTSAAGNSPGDIFQEPEESGASVI